LRLDNYLRTSRLIKKRSLVKELCGQGAITVNGIKAKAGKGLKEGDRIFIDFWNRSIELEVMLLPQGNVSRKEAGDLYRVLEEKKKSIEMEW